LRGALRRQSWERFQPP